MKDVFVNKGIFYERIGDLLDQMESELCGVWCRINELYQTDYLPEGLRKKAERARDGHQRVRILLAKIEKIFKEDKAQRSTVHVIKEQKRVERMTVIKGGLSAAGKRIDDGLSDEFRAYLHQERTNQP